MNRQLFTRLCILLLAPSLLVSPLRAQAKQPADASAKSTIAVFQLRGPVTESPVDEMAVLFGGDMGVSLKDLVGYMKKAGDDPNVKAVVILDQGSAIGLAQTEEIRQAIKQLRVKGKDVYAHCDSLGLRNLAMLGGVSRLSVVPTGDLMITGLYSEMPYIRGLLDKIGVQPDFITCGAYKSAGEIFMRSEPSPEADAMHNWLFDGMYQSIVRLIAQGRGVDESKVRAWIDNGLFTARTAKDKGIIDAVEYREDFEAMLREKYGDDLAFDRKYGKEQKKSLDLSNPLALFKIWGEAMSAAKKKPDKPSVAIVYVDGGIVAGKSETSPLMGKVAGSTDIRKALDEAARDESIKAVVLRVDSPGGSATGSEIILEATRRVKAKKPFVVSMGNVAGSGGYYVACGADTIFADESTITGSIGVVSGKFYTNPMWDKVGISFKAYERGANAGLLSTGQTWSPEQKQKMQSWMDEIYDVFKGHVTAIRGNKLKKPIDELAGGRVYTGRQALELGLVDEIGTLSDAVAFVAREAGLSGDYDVRVIPQPKNFVEQLVEQLSGGGDKDDSKYLHSGAGLGGGSLVDVALPHLRQLDPQRVRVILRALRQMETIRDEGCAMMMPEIVFDR